MSKVHARYRRRVRPSGYSFLIIAFLVQLAAWNTGTNLLYMIAGAVESFLLAGFLMGRFALRGLAPARSAPAAVHRGDSIPMTIRIENRRRFFPAVSLRVESSSGAGESGAYIGKIPARKAAIVRLGRTFSKRGVHPLPAVRIRSAFPLGLFEGTLVYNDGREVVVYPRIQAVRTAILEELNGTGETPRLRRGDGDEFFSLREYMPGDDVRKISWRVSARVGHLVIRELEPNTSRNVVIVLDSRFAPELPEFEEYFEDSVDLAASLALSYINKQYSVSVVTPDSRVDLGEGNGHAVKILDMLARIFPANPARHADDWFGQVEEARGIGYLVIAPDPGRWGRPCGKRGARVVNPGEVVRA